jgi:hypothetical protein
MTSLVSLSLFLYFFQSLFLGDNIFNASLPPRTPDSNFDCDEVTYHCLWVKNSLWEVVAGGLLRFVAVLSGDGKWEYVWSGMLLLPLEN